MFTAADMDDKETKIKYILEQHQRKTMCEQSFRDPTLEQHSVISNQYFFYISTFSHIIYLLSIL